MKRILTFLMLLMFVGTTAQVITQERLKRKNTFCKNIYKELFKYSTIYVAGDIKNPKENPKDYFVRTNPDGNLYAPPVVVDGTDYYDFDYRYGFGIRKLARFDYEIKGRHYYDGTENNIGLSASNSPVSGLEYTFHCFGEC